ncbi:insulin receptor-related protein [Drosophila tropicalis]|uniref:insulin receptor-related protein n=1 Tax=Drosophila tropicalis TaxID=46794 RepID=UPI0035ABBC19
MMFGNMLLGLGIVMLLTTIAPLADGYKECTSIDIRNECNKMKLLDNCTVVTGFVMIALMPSHPNQCNYTDFTFPDLIEITEYMILHDVRGMVNIGRMFPHLTVIRGRRLFLNYALGVTSMPDLQLLEFPSLVAIQRGHVYIGNCPKLCQLERVNWNRLTLSTGQNHIIIGDNNCTQRSICKGCDSGYCWSNFYCQRFENDNVAHIKSNANNCHEECLGGCHQNETASKCQACRGISDGDVCVSKCPEGKYFLEQYQRCYNRTQCINDHEHYIYGSECVAFCPSGFRANNKSECTVCDEHDPCISICSPEPANDTVNVTNLADADELRGCQFVNGSLTITIRNQVNESQLAHSLSSIREIRGYLKIYRSSQLSNLKFLNNLEVIQGNPLEHSHYSLIVYDNKQLSQLWHPVRQLQLKEGGMFIHRNNKLCNKAVLDFQVTAKHDKALDSTQTNDQEVLCSPAKLQLSVQIRTHRTVELIWPKSETSVKVEVIYRTVPTGLLYHDHSELEAPVCTRINWERRILFPDNLIDLNETHYKYKLDRLQPDTRYVCLVRTFGGDVKNEARSELTYVLTEPDIPQPPKVELMQKTDSSLTVRLMAQDQNHDHYVLTVFELPDDTEYLDSRNYCHHPSYLWQDMQDGNQWRESALQDYDYDDCCAHKEEMADDRRFKDEMRDQYRCSLDQDQNCHDLNPETNPMQQMRLLANTTQYELNHLNRYSLYSLELQACNGLGCSSPTILNDRTNYTLGADLPTELSACYVGHSKTLIMRFKEPQLPNAMVVYYVIHYQKNLSEKGPETQISCLTRKEHALANYVHVAMLNITFDDFAVRVHSLAGEVAITPFKPITTCSSEELLVPGGEIQQDAHLATVIGSEHGHGVSIFLICFLLGCSLSLIWVMYKRRCWRKLPGLRRYVPVREQWLRERQQTEDREILVDGFETVRFQNNNNSHNSNHIADEYQM